MPPSPAPTVGTRLNLRFSDVNGFELHFKLNTTNNLGKAMRIFAERVDRPVKSLRFLHDGRRLTEDSTAESLGIEDGDTIEVHAEQFGGWLNVCAAREEEHTAIGSRGFRVQ